MCSLDGAWRQCPRRRGLSLSTASCRSTVTMRASSSHLECAPRAMLPRQLPRLRSSSGDDEDRLRRRTDRRCRKKRASTPSTADRSGPKNARDRSRRGVVLQRRDVSREARSRAMLSSTACARKSDSDRSAVCRRRHHIMLGGDHGAVEIERVGAGAVHLRYQCDERWRTTLHVFAACLSVGASRCEFDRHDVEPCQHDAGVVRVRPSRRRA